MTIIISDSLMNRAKNRAIEYLEFNIASIAVALDLDLDSLSSSMEIPVSESDSDYYAYNALKKMCAAWEALQE